MLKLRHLQTKSLTLLRLSAPTAIPLPPCAARFFSSSSGSKDAGSSSIFDTLHAPSPTTTTTASSASADPSAAVSSEPLSENASQYLDASASSSSSFTFSDDNDALNMLSAF